ASLGGPIKRDKSFLFFSWESLRNVQSSPGSAGPMPSALEVGGDFSQSKNKPIDPTTSLPFPNNVIPASQISKQALAIANLHFQRNCNPIDPSQYPGGSGVAPGFRFQDVGVMTVPSDPQYVVSTRFGSIAGYFGTNGNTYFDVTPWVHEFRDSLTITLGSHL